MNSAVIVRVWPRPYSVWEDNPEDPEAIDGYFLLDVNEKQPQDLLEKHNTHSTQHTVSVKNDMAITCLFCTLLVKPVAFFFVTNWGVKDRNI